MFLKLYKKNWTNLNLIFLKLGLKKLAHCRLSTTFFSLGYTEVGQCVFSILFGDWVGAQKLIVVNLKHV